MTLSIPTVPGRTHDIALAASVHLAMAGSWTAAQLGLMLAALRPVMAVQGFVLAQGKAEPAEKSAARAWRVCAALVANPLGGGASPSTAGPAAAQEGTALEVSARILMDLDSTRAGALRCHLQFLARLTGRAPGARRDSPFLFGRTLSHPLDAILLRQDRARALVAGVAGCLGEDPQDALAALARDFVQQLAEQLEP